MMSEVEERPRFVTAGTGVNGLRGRETQPEKSCKLQGIAHCRNMRVLGRVSSINQIENLNISTEMLMNEKLPN